MGWTIYHRAPTDPRAELRSICTWNRDDSAARVLADSLIGSTWYAAVETTYKADGRRVVWAAVFLTTRRGGWGYKDMCESMGPTESRCPARILNMLSPLDETYGHAGYAAEWRERCRANLAAKREARPIRGGDVVRFSSPYTIGGQKVDTFKAVQVQRRGRSLLRFQTLEGHGPYMLGNWRRYVAEVSAA